MREVVRMCRNVCEQLIRCARITSVLHGVGTWDVPIDVVAQLKVHDMAGNEPRYDEYTEGNVAGSFLAKVTKDFRNL